MGTAVIWYRLWTGGRTCTPVAVRTVTFHRERKPLATDPFTSSSHSPTNPRRVRWIVFVDVCYTFWTPTQIQMEESDAPPIKQGRPIARNFFSLLHSLLNDHSHWISYTIPEVGRRADVAWFTPKASVQAVKALCWQSQYNYSPVYWRQHKTPLQISATVRHEHT
jgi:hypothetical protein